mmetsp:Transcript_4851/g.14636  ORF Transcript_4851/g.14636 Transcript_4851/m.14636 type:complete len:202 (-) Transcript_4851:162-767(-)
MPVTQRNLKTYETSSNRREQEYPRLKMSSEICCKMRRRWTTDRVQLGLRGLLHQCAQVVKDYCVRVFPLAIFSFQNEVDDRVVLNTLSLERRMLVEPSVSARLLLLSDGLLFGVKHQPLPFVSTFVLIWIEHQPLLLNWYFCELVHLLLELLSCSALADANQHEQRHQASLYAHVLELFRRLHGVREDPSLPHRTVRSRPL